MTLVENHCELFEELVFFSSLYLFTLLLLNKSCRAKVRSDRNLPLVISLNSCVKRRVRFIRNSFCSFLFFLASCKLPFVSLLWLSSILFFTHFLLLFRHVELFLVFPRGLRISFILSHYLFLVADESRSMLRLLQNQK